MEVVEEVRVAKDFRDRLCRQDRYGPDLSPLLFYFFVVENLYLLSVSQSLQWEDIN